MHTDSSLLLSNLPEAHSLLSTTGPSASSDPVRPQATVAAHIRADSILGTAESLILRGNVHLTYGDCLLRTPFAQLDGALANGVNLERLDSPELHVEWLNSKGRLCRLDCSGPCQALFQQGCAILTATEGERLEWSDEEHRIESRVATLWFQMPQWQMERLHLQGDVRLHRRPSAESQAPSQLWAENAEIFLTEKVVVLKAERPAAVMLWNRGASQELACQRLRIWKDPLTQEWIQEAEGGVKVTLAGDVVHKMARSLQDQEDEDDDDDADF